MDFKAHLRRQLRFIDASCRHYDLGDMEEAVRIATALRVLFYDSRSCKSLLNHLGFPHVQVLSTAAPFVPEPPMPDLYLVEMVVNLDDPKQPRCRCVPVLSGAKRHEMIYFEDWWNECIIKHFEPSTLMSRKELVLAAANKDGGAHVDSAQHPVYEYVSRGSGLELEFCYRCEIGLPPLKIAFENIQYASLRQIGYEIQNSPCIAALGR